jgi:hypothetical protein
VLLAPVVRFIFPPGSNDDLLLRAIDVPPETIAFPRKGASAERGGRLHPVKSTDSLEDPGGKRDRAALPCASLAGVLSGARSAARRP